MKRPKVVNMSLALPADIRSWIEGRAAADLATMNAVICQKLRQQMQAEQQEKAGRPSASLQ